MHVSSEGSQIKNVAVERCVSQTHTKAHDADKALPVSELLYKEKKRNR